jgi:hypothetical protein
MKLRTDREVVPSWYQGYYVRLWVTLYWPSMLPDIMLSREWFGTN